MAGKRYRRKPIEVNAIQWDGDNTAEVYVFVGNFHISEYNRGQARFLDIQASEGTITLGEGDFIIKGVTGKLIPVKEQVFLQSYEEV